MRQILVALFVFSLAGCNNGGSNGQLVANNAKLVKSDSSVTRVACTGAVTACSPTNLQGRIYSASVMLGPLGDSAYGMTWLGATDDIINDPSTGKGGTLEFNLTDQTTFSGKISIPTEAKMPSPPTISRAELNFDYVDATFTLSGTTGVDGAYTVRTIFVTDTTVDDVTGTLYRADKMVKAPGETAFKWCNATTCSADRTAVATGLLTDSTLKNYQHPGQGNLNYPPYSVNLKEDLSVTYAQISSTTNVWTLDFDLASAVQFEAMPSTFDSVSDVVQNFKLKYAPNSSSSQGSDDDGIRATLTIAAPGAKG